MYTTEGVSAGTLERHTRRRESSVGSGVREQYSYYECDLYEYISYILLRRNRSHDQSIAIIGISADVRFFQKKKNTYQYHTFGILLCVRSNDTERKKNQQ